MRARNVAEAAELPKDNHRDRAACASAPVAHGDRRTRTYKRMRALAEGYATQLGGWQTMNEPQLAAVYRAAELAVLAEDTRRARLAGDVATTLEDLIRLDNAAHRAQKALGLRLAGAPAKRPGQALEEHLARLRGESTEREAETSQ